MEEDELFIFVIACIAAFVGWAAGSSLSLNRLTFRDNPALGIIRLSVPAALAWIVYVLWNHADPSVTGIYFVFYLVIGYALTKLLGQVWPRVYGVRLSVDAYQRKNVAAAIFIASFTLATAMIYGGCLWGEADPTGDDEGGWWIPLGFFILGWGIFATAFHFYTRSEIGNFGLRIRQNRSVQDARAAGSYVLSTAAVLTEAVAGDFFGWMHGLASLALIAGMLLMHSMIARGRAWLTTQSDGAERTAGRIVESLLYAAMAIGFWLLHRTMDV